MPYRVSLELLRDCFGSEDNTLKDKLRERCKKAEREIEGMAANDDTPYFKDIVEELLDGKATHTNRKYGYIYWYAIENFIKVIGLQMYANDWSHASADAFWDNKAFKLYDIDAPMPITKPDDVPTVFVLRNAMMTDELESNLEQKVTNSYQIAQLKNWLKEAKQYQQDLVLYYF